MNDRYLFKAMRTDNREWVVGSLLIVAKINFFICPGKIKLDESLNGGLCPEVYAVLEPSICQCTGLKDKNGELIFEGDIVKHYNDMDCPEDFDTGVIYWDKGNARFKRGSEYELEFTIDSECEYEVIGNFFNGSRLAKREEES